MTQQSLRRNLIIIGVAIALVALYVLTTGFGFPLDDSWIHQTYARNLAESGQWAFLPNQPSAASTSPLYTVVLAIGYVFQIDYALWTHALGALALGLAGVIGARMILQILPNARFAPLFGGLAIVGTWHLVWASASGMETTLFAMLCLAVMGLAWRELDGSQRPRDEAGRGVVFGVAVALVSLARPEGILLGALSGLAILFVWRGLRWAWLLGATIGFFVVISPYLALNYSLTGGLLPNTANAKFEQFAPLLALPLYERVWDLVLVALAGGHALFLPACVVYVAHIRQKRGFVLYLLPLVWCVALILLYALRLPAPYQHGRYVMPLLPAWVMCGAVGMAVLLQWGRYTLLKRVLTRTLALATALSMAVFVFGIGLRAFQDEVTIINEEMVASAFWIRDNLPKEALLAIHDIGAVGYFSGRKQLLDIAGLISPEVVPIVTDGDALWELLEAESMEYLMAFPDQIPNDNLSDPRLCEVFKTGGRMVARYGASNMAIYRLTWDGLC